MMIEKSGSIRLRDIPVAGNLPPEQQALAAGMVRVTHLYRSALKVAVTQMEILDEEFARMYDHSPIPGYRMLYGGGRSAAAAQHRVGDAGGGLSVEVPALGLHQCLTAGVVRQQGQGAVRNGIVGAGSRPAMFGKKRLIACLAAAHQHRGGHAQRLGSACYADDRLTPQALAVQMPLAGNDQPCIPAAAVKIHGVQHHLNAHTQRTTEKGNRTRTETACGPAAGQRQHLYVGAAVPPPHWAQYSMTNRER